jgi:hypothetical protein
MEGEIKMFFSNYTKRFRSVLTGFVMSAFMLMLVGINASTANAANRVFDYTGDNRTDFVTVNFVTGGPIQWRVGRNPQLPGANQAFIRYFNFGLSAVDNIAASGDYNLGDLKHDPTVWRETTAPGSAPGTYYIANFPEGPGPLTIGRTVNWGNGFTDISTAEGDYDGDGKLDYTVIRVIGGTLNWFIMSSATSVMRQIPFGTINGVTGPTIFPGADFNGNGRDDLVYLYRNAAGLVTYQIGDAVSGAGIMTISYGNWNTDFSLAPNDYTGDGRADLVAVRQTQGASAVWYIRDTFTGNVTGTRFGINDPTFNDLDFPVRGDYDGDGKHDIAVWRPSNQTWYWIRSTVGGVDSQKFGEPNDFPLAVFASY